MKDEIKKEQIEDLYKIGKDILEAQKKKKGYSDGLQRILTGLYPDNAHFIFELLQNAEDAGASDVLFELSKNKLIFTHNGQKLFDYNDIDSITNIGFSTKKDDVNAIGKFGVGFKAVFAYTKTPRVFSGEYCFEIQELICPFPLQDCNDTLEKTRFEFPFNHPQKPEEQACKEISYGLTELQDNVLLFLNNIGKITWNIDGIGSGSIARKNHNNIIEIKHYQDLNKAREITLPSTYWLRFLHPIAEKSKFYVAAAFRLQFKDENDRLLDETIRISEKMKIVPIIGQLSVFFPAEKETTNLRFHIHGPYASTVARDSIPYNNENNDLIDKTGILLASSLHKIKELGLLDVYFLDVLPNSRDELKEFYRPLLTKIIKTMQNSPLVPTHKKGHASATELLQGHRDIKDVITDNELSFFVGEGKQWTVGVMNNTYADHLIKDLTIKEWKWSELLEAVKKNFNRYDRNFKTNIEWLKQRDDEWMQKFYALLDSAMDYNKKNVGSSTFFPTSWAVVRTQDDDHITGNNVYFPGDVNSVPFDGLVRVKAEILRGNNKSRIEKAHKLLESTGVKEAGEQEEIGLILDKYYSTGSQVITEEVHIKHIKKFISWWEKQKDVDLFNGFYILKSNFNSEYHQPADLFIDQPYLDTGLSNLYKDSNLWHGYLKLSQKSFISFVKAVGIKYELEIMEQSTYYHKENKFLRKDYRTGAVERYETRIDKDYKIEGIEGHLGKKDYGVSLLVWKTLSKTDPNYLMAKYRPNRKYDIRIKPSTLVHQLKSIDWIPDKNGDFHSPEHITKDRLPKDFTYDDRNGWLTSIGFGENVKKLEETYKQNQEMAIQLGIPFALVEKFAGIPKEKSDEVLSKLLETIETELSPKRAEPLPTSQTSNSDRRREKAAQQAKQAQDKRYEEVTRSIRTTAYINDPQAKEYLRNHNTNENGNVICQLCNNKMPFKIGNNDYFEAVQFIRSIGKEIDANRLALCPNCAAEFSYVCDTSDKDKNTLLLSINNFSEDKSVINLSLPVHSSLRFTQRHLIDLQAALRSLSEYDDNIDNMENPNVPDKKVTSEIAIPNKPVNERTIHSPTHSKKILKACMYCGTAVKESKYKKHIEQNCSKIPHKSSLMICPHCSRSIRQQEWRNHRLECPVLMHQKVQSINLSKYSFGDR